MAPDLPDPWIKTKGLLYPYPIAPHVFTEVVPPRWNWCCIHVEHCRSSLFRVTFSFALLPPIKNVTLSDQRTFSHFSYQNMCTIAQRNRPITWAAIRKGFWYAVYLKYPCYLSLCSRVLGVQLSSSSLQSISYLIIRWSQDSEQYWIISLMHRSESLKAGPVRLGRTRSG
jgi:hypothetical protein